ncbi:MAG: site-specific DNA-methyltransferase [Alphaproteobacteria bacterium]|nr:site-specific DNA-methyltransferase [Alphaproteobacteria bacterium]
MVAKKNKAPRNKTIELSRIEAALYISQAIKLNSATNLSDIQNQVICQDCFKAMEYLPSSFVDLMIVDPPYNLTKNFGKNIFKAMEAESYLAWLDSWLSKTVRLLKDNASIYICSDWKTSLFIPEIAGKYFLLQNRISWEREKGRGANNNWKNCLEDIWFFTKSKNYTFNLDSVKIQRPVLAPYRDKKGNPKDWQESSGNKFRLTSPSNIWTDISIPFWSMPENTNHPTQKPEKLIAKLILASSNEGDFVFDPFLGSGTTAVVAKKLGRKYLGIEQEKEYAALALKRLDIADSNPQIQGFENGIFKSRNSGF